MAIGALLLMAMMVVGPPVLAEKAGYITTRASVGSDGSQGNGASGDSYNSSITPDARFVAFTSSASNLVTNDTNKAPDVFVRDMVKGTTTRVSVASDGSEAIGDPFSQGSYYGSISDDGRFVAFVSFAANLVPGDTNRSPDVFVHDRASGATARASVATDGTQASLDSDRPRISGDGRVVVFESIAPNLVSGDTNGQADIQRGRDIFVRDRFTGRTTRVSMSASGAEANGPSGRQVSATSADGRFVAFVSDADNLVTADTNFATDVFVHDRATNKTSRVSVSSGGFEGRCFSPVSFGCGSHHPGISGDGRYVSFYSFAVNFVDDLGFADTNGSADVFVHDRSTGTTTRVSVAPDATQGNSNSLHPDISADGRLVTFQSYANNLVSGDMNNVPDVFVSDLVTGAITRASVASAGVEANGESDLPVVATNGRVLFQSSATNLVVGDTNEVADLFLAKPRR